MNVNTSCCGAAGGATILDVRLIIQDEADWNCTA